MNPVVLRTLLALLPLLGFSLELRRALFYGGVAVMILIGTCGIFFFAHFLIPKHLHRLLALLLLSLLGALLGIFFLESLTPMTLLPAVSASLLMPPLLFRHEKHWRRIAGETIGAGFGFWIFLVAHGMLAEQWGSGLRLFRIPSGTYLLVGLALAFVPRLRKPR